jgi:hypothetical protein
MSNGITYGIKPPTYYIAVSQHGFGIDRRPAVAIRLAQTEVPASAKPSQLQVYRSTDEVAPIDFKRGAPVWPNGHQPKLAGLTSTHSLFKQQPRI